MAIWILEFSVLDLGCCNSAFPVIKHVKVQNNCYLRVTEVIHLYEASSMLWTQFLDSSYKHPNDLLALLNENSFPLTFSFLLRFKGWMTRISFLVGFYSFFFFNFLTSGSPWCVQLDWRHLGAWVHIILFLQGARTDETTSKFPEGQMH